MLVVNTIPYLKHIINNYYINKYYLKLMHDSVPYVYEVYEYRAIYYTVYDILS